MTRRLWLATVALAVAALTWVGCDTGRDQPTLVAGGNPSLGEDAIESYGCGSCHTIPGIDGADAQVGPPLEDFGERTYIAGQLLNTPENLARWIRDPQGVAPGTAMPDLGVSAAEARDIAAYLESLGEAPPAPAPPTEPRRAG